MHRITPHQPHPLFDSAATGRIERAAAAALPAHQLMQRAGLAVAQLAQALAPYARTVWLACGPRNNGGDGLEAAMHLQRKGPPPPMPGPPGCAHRPPGCNGPTAPRIGSAVATCASTRCWALEFLHRHRARWTRRMR